MNVHEEINNSIREVFNERIIINTDYAMPLKDLQFDVLMAVNQVFIESLKEQLEERAK